MAEARPGVPEGGVLSDKFIVKLANSLGAVYLQLGMLLGVGMAFVKRVESDWARDSLRVTIEVLNKWRETSPHRSHHVAMTTDLVTALTPLELTDVAEIVTAESDRVRASQRAAVEDHMRKLANPPSGDTQKAESKRCVEVFKFLKQLKQPQLWRSVADLIIREDGKLDLAEAVSPDDLPALKYILESGAASGITYLRLTNNNFTDTASSIALSESISQATWLNKLCLHGCALRKDDVDRQLPVISNTAGLRSLWLSANFLDDFSAETVMSLVLLSLPQLVFLALDRNELTNTRVARLRSMATSRPGLYLLILDLQWPPGYDRSETVAFHQQFLARVRGVTRELRTRPGDWARDREWLKVLEQKAVAHIQRLS